MSGCEPYSEPSGLPTSADGGADPLRKAGKPLSTKGVEGCDGCGETCCGRAKLIPEAEADGDVSFAAAAAADAAAPNENGRAACARVVALVYGLGAAAEARREEDAEEPLAELEEALRPYDDEISCQQSRDCASSLEKELEKELTEMNCCRCCWAELLLLDVLRVRSRFSATGGGGGAVVAGEAGDFDVGSDVGWAVGDGVESW